MFRSPVHRLRFLRDHRWVPERLSDYLDGELPGSGRVRLQRHLAECPDCHRALETLERLLSYLDRFGEPREDPEAGERAARIATGVAERLTADPTPREADGD